METQTHNSLGYSLFPQSPLPRARPGKLAWNSFVEKGRWPMTSMFSTGQNPEQSTTGCTLNDLYPHLLLVSAWRCRAVGRLKAQRRVTWLTWFSMSPPVQAAEHSVKWSCEWVESWEWAAFDSSALNTKIPSQVRGTQTLVCTLVDECVHTVKACTCTWACTCTPF